MSGGRNYGDPCGVARGLDVIGERWALLVVRELMLGPRRFNDLLTGLTGASPNVISQRLRDLVDSGVVHRFDVGPPANVRLYELTEWGRELEPLLLHLGRWGSAAPMPADGKLSVSSLMMSIRTVFEMAPALDQATCRYEVRTDADVLTFDAAPGSLRIRRGSFGGAALTLATNEETLRDLCTGGVSMADAVASGAAEFSGDLSVRDRLADLLASAA